MTSTRHNVVSITRLDPAAASDLVADAEREAAMAAKEATLAKWQASLARREAALATSTEAMLASPGIAMREAIAADVARAAERCRIVCAIDALLPGESKAMKSKLMLLRKIVMNSSVLDLDR
jgi:hypothetical protein